MVSGGTDMGDSGRGVDVSLFYFFFQAEDGIRDLTVTGVQTCALPISPVPRLVGARRCSVGKTSRAPSGLSVTDCLEYATVSTVDRQIGASASHQILGCAPGRYRSSVPRAVVRAMVSLQVGCWLLAGSALIISSDAGWQAGQSACGAWLPVFHVEPARAWLGARSSCLGLGEVFQAGTGG